ncbi:MAG: DUF2335 domain-containing protein [Spirochaetales bacterium]|nr:DUF2335 domain-containing protein [Spirochaetales bacterium]
MPPSSSNQPGHSITVWTSHSPVPPPDWLEYYERVIPGSGSQLLAQWHAQSEHRMRLEFRVVNSNIRMQYLGWLSATVLGLAGIGGGIFLVALGKELTGFGAVVSSVVALAAVFILGRRKQESELSAKRSLESQ